MRSRARGGLRRSAGLAAVGLVAGVLSATVVPASAEGASRPAAGTVFYSNRMTNFVLEVPPGGKSKRIGTGFSDPLGVAVDSAGDLFVADSGNNRVVEIPAGGGAETTVGSGLDGPGAVGVDAAGDVYIDDYGNDRIVEVPAGGGSQKTIADDLPDLDGLTVDASGDVYYSQDTSPGSGNVDEIPSAGGPTVTVADVDGGSFAVDTDGDLYLPDGGGITVIPPGNAPQRIVAGSARAASTVTVDSAGDVYYYDNDQDAISKLADCKTTVVAKGIEDSRGLAVYDPATDRTGTTPDRTGTTPDRIGAGPDRAGTAPNTGKAATVGLTGSGSPGVPVITGVGPDSGPIAGGQTIFIGGNWYPNLDGTVTVAIGQPDGAAPIPATHVDVERFDISAVTGGGARPGKLLHVFVTDAGGTSAVNPKDVYQYALPPTITSISPASGPTTGCQQIVIHGTEFAQAPSGESPNGFNTVEIGQGSGADSTAIPVMDVDAVSSTEITATTTGGAKKGAWYVFVTSQDGTSVQKSRQNVYDYVAP